MRYGRVGNFPARLGMLRDDCSMIRRLELYEAVLDRIDDTISELERSEPPGSDQLRELREERDFARAHSMLRNGTVGPEAIEKDITYCAVDHEQRPCSAIRGLADKYGIVYQPVEWDQPGN